MRRCRTRARMAARKLNATLVHLLARIDAPEAILLDPAVKTLARDPAPDFGTALDDGEHAGLQPGRDGTRRVRGGVQRHNHRPPWRAPGSGRCGGRTGANATP